MVGHLNAEMLTTWELRFTQTVKQEAKATESA